MYIPSSRPACTEVKSPIYASGWCKLFKAGRIDEEEEAK
jgi:hypothetical protein